MPWHEQRCSNALGLPFRISEDFNLDIQTAGQLGPAVSDHRLRLVNVGNMTHLVTNGLPSSAITANGGGVDPVVDDDLSRLGVSEPLFKRTEIIHTTHNIKWTLKSVKELDDIKSSGDFQVLRVKHAEHLLGVNL
jgi:hypothetical protein